MGELTVIVHLILWGIRSLIFFFFFLSAPFLTYSEPQLLLFLEKNLYNKPFPGQSEVQV